MAANLCWTAIRSMKGKPCRLSAPSGKGLAIAAVCQAPQATLHTAWVLRASTCRQSKKKMELHVQGKTISSSEKSSPEMFGQHSSLR